MKWGRWNLKNTAAIFVNLSVIWCNQSLTNLFQESRSHFLVFLKELPLCINYFVGQVLIVFFLGIKKNCNNNSNNSNREVLGNTAVLGTNSGPYRKISVGKAEGTTDVSWHRLRVVLIAPLYPLNTYPLSTSNPLSSP